MKTGQYLRLQISGQEFPKDPLQVFCNETFMSQRFNLSFGFDKYYINSFEQLKKKSVQDVHTWQAKEKLAFTKSTELAMFILPRTIIKYPLILWSAIRTSFVFLPPFHP